MELNDKMNPPENGQGPYQFEWQQIARLLPSVDREHVLTLLTHVPLTHCTYSARIQFVLRTLLNEMDAHVDEEQLQTDAKHIQTVFPTRDLDAIVKLSKEVATAPNRNELVLRKLLVTDSDGGQKRHLAVHVSDEIPNKCLKLTNEATVTNSSFYTSEACSTSISSENVASDAINESRNVEEHICDLITAVEENREPLTDVSTSSTTVTKDSEFSPPSTSGSSDYYDRINFGLDDYMHDSDIDDIIADRADRSVEFVDSPHRADHSVEFVDSPPPVTKPIEEGMAAAQMNPVAESSTSTDHPHFYKLLDIFPDACPNYLRKLCVSVPDIQPDLTELISRILEVGNYPKRPQRPPSPPETINVEDQLAMLHQLLPDADPTYLEEKSNFLSHDGDAFREFVNEAIETKNYPTKKEYLRKMQLSAQQKQYTTEFDIDNFLAIFPDPHSYFRDPKRKPCDWTGSTDYVHTFLRNHFPMLTIRTITDCVRQHNGYLIKVVAALNQCVDKRLIMKSRRKASPLPAVMKNIPLLQEIAFIQHESEIKDHVARRRLAAEAEKLEAKRSNTMTTCNCCYDDEIMPKHVVMCPKGCQFCRDCVRKSVDVAFGLGKLDFPCLADCDTQFTLQILKSVLEPKLFSKIALKKQVAEVKAAGLDDLETCPFCDFVTIPAIGDKLFHCLNPECMKDSCRECKEPSHLPLRCDEVEKEDDVKRRTYIENKMTEALLRKCNKCGLAFIKETGCNKMTCSCGNFMCYVCGKSIQDYKHFDQSFNPTGRDFVPKNGLCPLYSNTVEMHKENIIQGANNAKAELGINEDPTKLKIDPSLDIEKYYKNRKPPATAAAAVAAARFPLPPIPGGIPRLMAANPQPFARHAPYHRHAHARNARHAGPLGHYYFYDLNNPP